MSLSSQETNVAQIGKLKFEYTKTTSQSLEQPNGPELPPNASKQLTGALFDILVIEISAGKSTKSEGSMEDESTKSEGSKEDESKKSEGSKEDEQEMSQILGNLAIECSFAWGGRPEKEGWICQNSECTHSVGADEFDPPPEKKHPYHANNTEPNGTTNSCPECQKTMTDFWSKERLIAYLAKALKLTIDSKETLKLIVLTEPGNENILGWLLGYNVMMSKLLEHKSAPGKTFLGLPSNVKDARLFFIDTIGISAKLRSSRKLKKSTNPAELGPTEYKGLLRAIKNAIIPHLNELTQHQTIPLATRIDVKRNDVALLFRFF